MVKKLNFAPQYHRKVAQGKYVPIASRISDDPDSITYTEAKIEHDEIVAQGFSVVNKDMERPFKRMTDVDKGDVVSVLAKTNPEFKLSLEAHDC